MNRIVDRVCRNNGQGVRVRKARNPGLSGDTHPAHNRIIGGYHVTEGEETAEISPPDEKGKGLEGKRVSLACLGYTEEGIKPDNIGGKMAVKQAFRYEWNNKVYGCSFRKDHRNGQYFGHVTVYDSLEEYNNPTHWEDRKNIPLRGDTVSDAASDLRRFCKEELT